MTPKERAAMQQALDALEEAYAAQFEMTWFEIKPEHFTALRDALDHSSEATDMVAEQAEQEPVAKFLEDNLVVENERVDKSGHRVLEIREEELLRIMEIYATPVKQAEQEPIGEVDPYMDFLRINWKDDKHPPRGTKLYLHPVRTKDLTDDEIRELDFDMHQSDADLVFARAVIAKFKEKNK